MISLERFLVLCGKGNRRECAYLIRQGVITVNGQTVKDSKKKIAETDSVQQGRDTLKAAPLKSFLLWKPTGSLCQKGEAGPSAYELLPEIHGLALVGRLDKDSEGLIIATNDGDLSFRLTDPEQHLPKTYHVKVKGSVSEDWLTELCSGLHLDGKKTRKLTGKVLRKEGKNTWLQLILTEGKKRQIRRLCEQGDKIVLRLIRVAIGPITTAGLKPEAYRELNENEISQLFGKTE
jgi:23S rRNA pseudouridine2605 synthase